MAVELVLRLCQVDEDDGGLPGAGKSPGEPGYDPSTAHIAIQDFIGGLYDILGGYHTATQMKAFYSMSTEQQDNFDALWGKITSVAQLSLRLGRIMRFKSILNKWERRDVLQLAAYGTPDAIQTQLLALDQGFTG